MVCIDPVSRIDQRIQVAYVIIDLTGILPCDRIDPFPEDRDSHQPKFDSSDLLTFVLYLVRQRQISTDESSTRPDRPIFHRSSPDMIIPSQGFSGK
jgi:hypothetical protein